MACRLPNLPLSFELSSPFSAHSEAHQGSRPWLWSSCSTGFLCSPRDGPECSVHNHAAWCLGSYACMLFRHCFCRHTYPIFSVSSRLARILQRTCRTCFTVARVLLARITPQLLAWVKSSRSQDPPRLHGSLLDRSLAPCLAWKIHLPCLDPPWRGLTR